MSPKKKPALKVFISYSHKDEKYKNELVTMLAVLRQRGIIAPWQDRKIREGAEWRKEIEKAMNECDLAVLLVSADFLASRFITEQELPRLLKRRAREGLLVVPIIVRECLWKSEPLLRKIQVLPKDGKPVVKFSKSSGNRDQVWTEIATAIENRAKEKSA